MQLAAKKTLSIGQSRMSSPMLGSYQCSISQSMDGAMYYCYFENALRGLKSTYHIEDERVPGPIRLRNVLVRSILAIAIDPCSSWSSLYVENVRGAKDSPEIIQSPGSVDLATKLINNPAQLRSRYQFISFMAPFN